VYERARYRLDEEGLDSGAFAVAGKLLDQLASELANEKVDR
jgi:hypothetical protein